MSGAKTITNWLMDPVHQCVLFLGDEMKLTTLTIRSITSSGLIERLLVLLSLKLREDQDAKNAEELERYRLLLDGHQEWVAQQISGGFAVPYTHSLISLWAAVENCIENIVVLILMRDANSIRGALETAGNTRLRPNAGDVLSEEEARDVYRSLERKYSGYSSVTERYDGVLGVFGLAIVPDSGLAAEIGEINSVRNCLLHRGGFIDEKAVRQSPTLQKFLGEKLVIDEQLYLGYSKSIGEYVLLLMARVLDSRYCTWRGESPNPYEAPGRQGVNPTQE